MTQRKSYMDGTHELTVTINRDGTRYVTGAKWGCSRDYIADSDSNAIRQFLAEHACQCEKQVNS